MFSKKKKGQEAKACSSCRKLENVEHMENGLCDRCATKAMHRRRELEMKRKEGRNE